MNGLEEVGIPGREYLREALTNCSDPLKAIEEFQIENGILLPSLHVMLPLLDLHGVRRLQFHVSVLEELKEKLLTQIENLGKGENAAQKEAKLKELLVKSFPVIRVPSLQPVVMAILKNLDHVEDKYLKQIVSEKSLYQKCDVSVKRQIWQEHQGLYGDEVSPLFSQYIKDKEQLLNQVDIGSNFFALSPRQRRQNPVIQELVKMIGKNLLLYDTTLQFLRTLFLRTKNVHYCTLRVELLMALHDADVQDITAMDPCHKFTWCLDACIREQNIDIKRSRELQGFLEGVRKGQEQVLGDLSVTLCDPYSVNFLATSALKIMNHLVANESLPRGNSVLVLILRMLNLGLHAWDILNSQVYREPKLDSEIITKFIPTLMSLVVDDQVRSVNAKLPPDDRESALTIIEHSGPVPELYEHFLAEDRLAATLATYYTFQVCKARDKQGIMRVLGTLANSHDNRALDGPFMHNLVAYFVPMGEEFANEDFCTVVFDEFFLTVLPQSNVSHQLIKLLWHVYSYLPPHRLESLMTTLSSLQLSNETSRNLFQQLQEKVAEHLQTTASKRQLDAQEDMDFAISVPTPSIS
ncbi:negative elongation factor B-like protein [Dinothrombium tinctorium]|uniref:Negative elongation factor B-like protein n=1 Tax=Dinothrombium tinctorium TaxID=1965070 RepID=A0A3S3PS05_9ACAR|nr:negative elongation factor B-like protein [Dinothrombium tinctorium]